SWPSLWPPATIGRAVFRWRRNRPRHHGRPAQARQGGKQQMRIDAGFMRRIAAAAADQTLPRFRRAGAVANKLAAGFDPVTEADREAELAIRALIGAEFPEHGILGEEFGLERGDSRHRWVIDPIDGTRAFISGLPLWGTLVGLTEDGDAVAGMMSQPFTGELFWADDEAARYEGPGGARQLSTRSTGSLA